MNIFVKQIYAPLFNNYTNDNFAKDSTRQIEKRIDNGEVLVNWVLIMIVFTIEKLVINNLAQLTSACSLEFFLSVWKVAWTVLAGA